MAGRVPKKTAEVNFALSRAKMFNELRSIVGQGVRLLGIKENVGDGLADIAFSALGKDFFDSVLYKTNRVTRKKEISHPLIRALIGGNVPELGTSELLEIGLYLKCFSTDPRINDCITTLKLPAQYESTLFQLAMAYRLKMVGCEVCLEPPTIRGRSDIEFRCENVTYIGECYRVNRTFWDYVGAFEDYLYKELIDLVPSGKKYAFTVKLNSLLTFHGMRETLKRYQEILDEFNSRDDLVRIELKYKNNVLGVEDITDLSEDPDFKTDDDGQVKRIRYLDADWCICPSSMKGGNIFRLLDNPTAEKDRGSRVIVWKNYKEKYIKSPYTILESKLSKKLKQAKVDNPGARRLLLVEFPCGLFFTGKISDQHRKIQYDAVKKFENVAGILLTERQAGTKNRFMYEGIFLPGRLENALPESVLERLNQVELSDIFDG